MNQSLIHVEDQHFLLRVRDPRLRKVDEFVPDPLLRHYCHVIFDEVQSLQRVLKMLPVQVHLLALAILINTSVSLWHLCYKISQDVATL